MDFFCRGMALGKESDPTFGAGARAARLRTDEHRPCGAVSAGRRLRAAHVSGGAPQPVPRPGSAGASDGRPCRGRAGGKPRHPGQGRAQLAHGKGQAHAPGGDLPHRFCARLLRTAGRSFAGALHGLRHPLPRGAGRRLRLVPAQRGIVPAGAGLFRVAAARSAAGSAAKGRGRADHPRDAERVPPGTHRRTCAPAILPTSKTSARCTRALTPIFRGIWTA